jgi:hypothetical protein
MNIWEDTVDNETWKVQVVDKGSYKGELQIIRLADDELVHSEPVAVSFDAIFGPYYRDVMQWQDRAIEVIDTLL